MHSLQINLVSDVEAEVKDKNVVSNRHRFLFVNSTKFYSKLNFTLNRNTLLTREGWFKLIHLPLLQQPQLFKFKDKFTLISLEPKGKQGGDLGTKVNNYFQLLDTEVQLDDKDEENENEKFSFETGGKVDLDKQVYRIYSGEIPVESLAFNLFVERDDILLKKESLDLDLETDESVDEEETIVSLLGLPPDQCTIYQLMQRIEPFLNKSSYAPNIKLLFNSNQQLVVVIQFKLFNSALAFYNQYHNRTNFFDSNSNPNQNQNLLVVFLQQLNLNFTKKEEVGTRSLGYWIPSCTSCLNLIDGSVTGLKHFDGEFYNNNLPVNSSSTRCTVCIKRQDYHTNKDHPATSPWEWRCQMCSFDSDLWICNLCGYVGCGRYHQAHASAHATTHCHFLATELETGSIWDYFGDHYVHQIPTISNQDPELPPPYVPVEEPFEVRYRNSLLDQERQRVVELVAELKQRQVDYTNQVVAKRKLCVEKQQQLPTQQELLDQLTHQLSALQKEASLVQRQVDHLSQRHQHIRLQRQVEWKPKVEEEALLLQSLVKNLVQVQQELKAEQRSYDALVELHRDLDLSLKFQHQLHLSSKDVEQGYQGSLQFK